MCVLERERTSWMLLDNRRDIFNQHTQTKRWTITTNEKTTTTTISKFLLKEKEEVELKTKKKKKELSTEKIKY